MKECPDLDTLVSVEEALGWDAENAMRHILSCEECITDVRHVERLHRVLDHELEPTPGFTDRVVAALPSPPCLSSEHEERHSWPVSAAIFVLATITAVLLLALAAIASPTAGGAGPDVLVFASLVGIAAVKMISRSVR